MRLHPGMSVDEQLEVLVDRATEVISPEELRDKLVHSRREGRPLKVKLGLDPSAPDIHLGHTVVLRKMRQFQDLGHEVVCLIGDFTGRVGDPSGASQTRRQLSEAEVRQNAQTYADQVFRILDPDRTTIEFNSKWLAALNFAEVVELASTVTVARMLERNDFADRLAAGQVVHVHEFFYPLMQGYDSVALRSDVELGGTDQKFNLMMARQIQRAYGQEPEVALLMPLMEGTDGGQKMSKSLGNYIGINEEPGEMYGKVMSIPDELITRYLRYLTPASASEVSAVEAALADGRVNPRDAKAQLAGTLVGMYCGDDEAARAGEEFDRVFARRQLPEDMEEVSVSDLLEDGSVWLVNLVRSAGFASSNSEARRLIEQGAVSLDGERIADSTANVAIVDGAVLRVGKRRFARLRRD
ncbi:MAG: tyrosine--tRNA ligase [Bacillota bacterium]